MCSAGSPCVLPACAGVILTRRAKIAPLKGFTRMRGGDPGYGRINQP